MGKATILYHQFGLKILIKQLMLITICNFLQAEKNRAAAMANNLQKGNAGPMRLYVGSLHFNITEDMLRGIFEPFGRVGGK